VWLYVHGEWPSGDIDHRNNVHDDDRLKNIRDTTTSGNQQNQRRAHINNKLGILGVRPRNGKFQAQIQIDGDQRFLGTFPTAEAAHSAYLEAKRQLHQTCTI